MAGVGGWETAWRCLARPFHDLEADGAAAVHGGHLGDRGGAVAHVALPLLRAALVRRADEAERFCDLHSPVDAGIEAGPADDRGRVIGLLGDRREVELDRALLEGRRSVFLAIGGDRVA